MNFVVLGLDPSQLVNYFVAPLVEALITHVHLRIEDPQKAKALCRKIFNRDINDFLVAHRAVIEVELVIREHKTSVVPLGSLYPPWWIDVHNLKVANLLYQILKVEESKVAVDKGMRAQLFWRTRVKLCNILRHYFCLGLNWNLQAKGVILVAKRS